MPNHHPRNYDYDIWYGSQPQQKKRRAKRNHARRAAIRNGQAKKGDKTDVHHTDKKNLSGKGRVIDRSRNRSMK